MYLSHFGACKQECVKLIPFALIIKSILFFMNKTDIVNLVHETLECTKTDAARTVDAIIDSITSSLAAGQEVSIAGLGIFATKVREGRTGRNPRTGETIEIPSIRVPKFRAAKALKDAVK